MASCKPLLLMTHFPEVVVQSNLIRDPSTKTMTFLEFMLSLASGARLPVRLPAHGLLLARGFRCAAAGPRPSSARNPAHGIQGRDSEPCKCEGGNAGRIRGGVRLGRGGATDARTSSQLPLHTRADEGLARRASGAVTGDLLPQGRREQAD